MVEDFVEAWCTNNRINLFLIDEISDAGMSCTLSKRGGRNVALQFGHIHNNRVWHLEKRAPALARGLAIYPPTVQPTRKDLASSLAKSGTAIETFLRDLLSGTPQRRGFKKGVPTTLAYFVAHESHHRGNILLTLKECGHSLAKAKQYAIWNWDKI